VTDELFERLRLVIDGRTAEILLRQGHQKRWVGGPFIN
jgi:hypothetical protein